MDTEAASSLNPNPRSSLCEECGQNPSKYTCPGCSLRSCSLPCVKSHKQRTSCTGKRSVSQFVPLSVFNDSVLISDYTFLEDAKRVAESARRTRQELCGNPWFKLPLRLKLLKNAARQRKMGLLFLASGMSKREKNQSRYDQRTKSISWTIEWRFHSTDVILIDHGVDEHKSLHSIIEEHLKPGPWNCQLKPFCKEQLDSLKFFIQKNPKGLKSPFHELNIKASLGQQLSNILVVEYPVIHVFLPSHSCDFEIERVANTFSEKMEAVKPLDDPPSPKGVLFREEEIEEDDASSDTQFMDLMTYMNPDPPNDFQMVQKQVTHNMQQLLKASEDSKFVRNNERQACNVEERDGCSYMSSKALGLTENMDFDFGQDLRDAYSHLIEQVNPDDFLCLEGGFVEEMEGRRGDQLVMEGVSLREEDIEEGEIVEF